VIDASAAGAGRDPGNVKRKRSAIPISPGSKLGPAEKRRPPKVEKVKGDELPPPEQAAGRKARR